MSQLRRRPSRKDRKNSQVRWAVGIFVVLALVFGAIAHFYMTATDNVRPIDPKTFCPMDAKGPNSVTAILLDRTDMFNPTQQAAIRDRLNDIKDHTQRYDLLEIYTVEPTQKALLKPEFSACNPGRGEDVNAWTGNPRLVEERWQSLFADPLQHLLDISLSGGEAEISPIMESIQSIAVTRLNTAELEAQKTPRRLIVISDLLQYTKVYSQYKPVGSFADFRKTPYYQGVKADLSGIGVEFWYVRRQKTLHLQTDKHQDFWRDYVTDQGGSIDKFWNVPGL